MSSSHFNIPPTMKLKLKGCAFKPPAAVSRQTRPKITNDYMRIPAVCGGAVTVCPALFAETLSIICIHCYTSTFKSNWWQVMLSRKLPPNCSLPTFKSGNLTVMSLSFLGWYLNGLVGVEELINYQIYIQL